MDFRTVVELPRERVELGPQSGVLLAGSCFAEHIGVRMRTALPEGAVCVNPFGVLYNPESLRMALEIAAFGSLFFPEEYLFEGTDGLWHSWLHSSAFSSEKHEECAERIKAAYEEAAGLLRRADMLCVTFGTNRIYEHRTRGIVVGNCHKEPAAQFTERSLDVEEICAGWDKLLDDLAEEFPALRVVFTVSPYRYAKYGFHGSQLAKATLQLAVARLCAGHPNALYFPAYEIVVDELRDYRFYEADMLHPSAQAADYVWQRFAEWAFTDEMRDYAAEKAALEKAEAHRPLHPGSEEHRKFLETLERKREALRRKWATNK
ncbi:MAG: GSCFA domain-containing protein [Alloprevotella sp.]|nr:GSCFA domain-containing protein [Alloprevotella sp.]